MVSTQHTTLGQMDRATRRAAVSSSWVKRSVHASPTNPAAASFVRSPECGLDLDLGWGRGGGRTTGTC